MQTRIVKSLLALVLAGALPASLHAGKFHFPVGITYVDGLYDVDDKLQDLYTAAGYHISDDIVVPVSLSLTPYYEFDCGFAIGLDVGPVSFLVVEEASYFSDETEVSFIVPVGAHLRYTFLRDKNVSPYVRVGVHYPIVGGDNLDSSEIGFFGAAGIDFWRTKTIGMAFEVGYDTSRVTIQGPGTDTAEATFPGLTVSLFARF